MYYLYYKDSIFYFMYNYMIIIISHKYDDHDVHIKYYVQLLLSSYLYEHQIFKTNYTQYILIVCK